jgi:hypothetical protein
VESTVPFLWQEKRKPMVRITVDDRGAQLHLKLEGRLAGAWVSELEQCWRTYVARSPHKLLVVDLTDTEFVDLAGKYLLTLMHQSGVKFAARNQYMNALLSEITGTDPGHGFHTAHPQPEGVKS